MVSTPKGMSSSNVIGIDLGGTSIRAALFNSSGKILKKTIHRTPKKGKIVLLRLEEVINEVRSENVSGIGIGIAGIVDIKNGIFLGGPHLPADLKNSEIARLMKKQFKVPVVLENDARCFAIAESRLGAGKNSKSIFGLTLGTGIGGGLIRNGEVIRGAHAGAGEIGHMPVTDELARPSSKRTVELESVASGSGLERIYTSLTGRKKTAKEIEELFLKREGAAVKTFEMGRRALMKGFAAIQLLFDPDKIIVGGGLGRSTAYLRPAANAAKKLTFPSLKKMNIVRSSLGADAGMTGAALNYELSSQTKKK